jgi:hypothetical protein
MAPRHLPPHSGGGEAQRRSQPCSRGRLGPRPVAGNATRRRAAGHDSGRSPGGSRPLHATHAQDEPVETRNPSRAGDCRCRDVRHDGGRDRRADRLPRGAGVADLARRRAQRRLSLHPHPREALAGRSTRASVGVPLAAGDGTGSRLGLLGLARRGDWPKRAMAAVARSA